jgi:hypothetical protein
LNDASFWEAIKLKTSEYFPDKEKIDSVMTSVRKALREEYLNLMTVCRPVNENAEIDVSILRALLKKEKTRSKKTVANQDGDDNDLIKKRKEKKEEKESIPNFVSQMSDDEKYYQTQLKLALKWDRIDIAKKFIFTDENKDKVRAQI